MQTNVGGLHFKIMFAASLYFNHDFIHDFIHNIIMEIY